MEENKSKGFKDRLTSLFSLPGKDEKIPAPGTPPTFNADGSVADDGNPFIGPIDPKLGYAREGYSGAQLRTIRRAQQRREAAQKRVGQRAYNRQQRRNARGQALVEQRQRVLDGEIEVPAPLFENITREAERLLATPTEEQVAQKRKRAARFRLDAEADRREKRFRAGKPRGKDLREDTFNEYESLLPTSARNRGVK